MPKLLSYFLKKYDFYLIFLMLITLLLEFFKSFSKYYLDLLIFVIAFWSTLPVLINSYKAIRKKEINVEQLATVALILSLIAGEYTSAIFINLMLAFARLFSDYTENRTNLAIEHLLKLRPKKAKVKRGNEILEILPEQVQKDDSVIVDLGDKIPVDGEIIEGNASIDQSAFTGESLPVDKKIGDKVFSSTIISSGSLVIRAEGIGKESSLEKIIDLIEKSQDNKAPIVRFGDKFAKWYLVSTFVAGIIIYFFTFNLDIVLGVLLVVCADDIAVAIPLAFLTAIGAAAKKGVIIKGSNYLEGIGNVQQIIFDKTGTLTKGKLTVEDVITLNNFDKEKVIELAGLAASFSDHPVSKAIFNFSKKENPNLNVVSVKDAKEVSGKGITANLNNQEIILGRPTLLHELKVHIDQNEQKEIDDYFEKGLNVTCLAIDGELAGIILCADQIKNSAQIAIKKLKDLQIPKLEMLTGDNEKVANAISQKIGLEDYHANLFPEDKLEHVKKHLEQGRTLVMVGDGVNDAPTLTLANIGIAMGGIGSDVAIQSADIIIMNDNLERIPYLIKLSRKVQNVSRQNFIIWGVVNMVGLALVFTGIFNPALAAAYNFITDFGPIINSLRLGWRRAPAFAKAPAD